MLVHKITLDILLRHNLDPDKFVESLCAYIASVDGVKNHSVQTTGSVFMEEITFEELNRAKNIIEYMYNYLNDTLVRHNSGLEIDPMERIQEVLSTDINHIKSILKV